MGDDFGLQASAPLDGTLGNQRVLPESVTTSHAFFAQWEAWVIFIAQQARGFSQKPSFFAVCSGALGFIVR